MKQSVKAIAPFVIIALFSIIICVVILQRKMNSSHHAYTTLLSEYYISRPTDHLFKRASELGFTSLYLEDKDSGKKYYNGLMTGTDGQALDLESLQTQLDKTEHAKVITHIISMWHIPDWTIEYNTEGKTIKSVGQN
jgi:hypothetical protein